MDTPPLPLVSLIIPSFNQRPDFLKVCLDSAIAQTYPNLEIIVSDNHSSAETLEVLAAYQDSRLRKVKPPAHLPLTPHFQWASEQARGEYLSFLPSDDWLEKECIEELVKLIEPHPNVVMGFCNVKQYYNGDKADLINLKPGIFPSEKEQEDYIKMSKLKGCLVGCLLRKSVYDKIGGIGHGNITFASDRWLFIQMANYGDAAYINKSYGVYRNENPLRKYRIYAYSQDVVRLFELILGSPLIRVKNLESLVTREKNKMAFAFLKAMPETYRSGHITEEEYAKTLDNLEILSTRRFQLKIIRLFRKKRSLGIFSTFFYVSGKYSNLLYKIKDKMNRIFHPTSQTAQ